MTSTALVDGKAVRMVSEEAFNDRAALTAEASVNWLDLLRAPVVLTLSAFS